MIDLTNLKDNADLKRIEALAGADLAVVLEQVEARVARLDLPPLKPGRFCRLALAHVLGVDDAGFARLVGANRTSTRDTIVLPAGRFERLSRGKGWARKGRGDSAEWGEPADDGGYRVGPGRWTVGSSDGFSRKEQTPWTVRHVSVGNETWTAAE